MTHWKKLIAGWCAVVLAAGLAAAADEVQLKSGQPITGVTVLREGCDAVEVDRNGDSRADQSLPADDVVRVVYGDAPAAFSQGSQLFAQRRYRDAVPLLESCLDVAGVRGWIQQYANDLLGECYWHLGQADRSLLPEARRAYRRVIDNAPKGRLAPAAIRGTGLCFLDEGKPEAARGQFQQLVDGAYGETWAWRGRLLTAELESRGGRHDAARAQCDELMRVVVEKNRLDLLAEVRETTSAVLFTAGDYAGARRLFTEVVRAADPHDVPLLARTYNAIGDCYVGEQRPQDALMAYLRVRVLYFEDAEELPRALYGAAACFAALRRPDRARELVALLENEYPDNRWTLAAKKDIPLR